MFLVYACSRLGTYFNLLVWVGALESCGTRFFRDIYKGGLWEDDVYVCPTESIASFGILLMKAPMEHYLDKLCPVLHFTATNFQEPG